MTSELTVKELIELLRNCPADLPVVVDSYEDGVDPITGVKTVQVVDYPNRQSYYGMYEEVDKNDATSKPALKLFSSRRGQEPNHGE